MSWKMSIDIPCVVCCETKQRSLLKRLVIRTELSVALKPLLSPPVPTNFHYLMIQHAVAVKLDSPTPIMLHNRHRLSLVLVSQDLVALFPTIMYHISSLQSFPNTVY
jgi:hypothetical protein